jgi:hypothetical protein
MLHTFQEILVCSFAYIVLVAIAYKPRTTAPTVVEDTAQPIEYFPEVEEETEPDPQPIVIVEPMPVAAFTAPFATVPAVDLSSLGVRELYKLASQRGIKGYKKISKAKLITLLS